MNKVLVVNLWPYGSQEFGQHFGQHFGDADLDLEEERAFHPFLKIGIDKCGGTIDIHAEKVTNNVILICQKCSHKYFIPKCLESFYSYWALITLKVHYGPAVTDNQRFYNLIPRTLILEADGQTKQVMYFPGFAERTELAVAEMAFCQDNWQANAIFEAIRALASIHGGSLKDISQELEKLIKELQSDFGWVYSN